MKFAFISDIHEDIISLKFVISQIHKYDIDKLVCLGDITGFSDLHHSHKESKNAEECINILKEHCDIIVAGNHDLNTLDKLPEYLIRHEEANSWIPKETWAYEGEVHSVLSDKNRRILNILPEYVIFSVENYKIMFSHFLYPDLTGSTMMIPEIRRELKPHFNFMEQNDCLLSFVGHTHIDGYALSTGNNVKFRDFGFHKLSGRRKIIFCPSIVNDLERSGYVIFDSKTFELTVLKLENL
jgi:predicted phosphodiesterase